MIFSLDLGVIAKSCEGLLPYADVLQCNVKEKCVG
jgi:hypothetical protein